MNDKDWGFGAILVGGRHVNRNPSLFSHLLLLRLKRGIVATKDLAVRQTHRELERLPFGIAEIGEFGIDFVSGTDGEFAVAVCAGILRVRLSRHPAAGEQADEVHGSKTATPS